MHLFHNIKQVTEYASTNFVLVLKFRSLKTSSFIKNIKIFISIIIIWIYKIDSDVALAKYNRLFLRI